MFYREVFILKLFILSSYLKKYAPLPPFPFNYFNFKKWPIYYANYQEAMFINKREWKKLRLAEIIVQKFIV